MPLTNAVIIKLNEMTAVVPDRSRLTESDTAEIRGMLSGLVESGESYDVGELEHWFRNEGSWPDAGVICRIVNMAGYVLDRHRQSSGLRMADDGCC